MQYSHVQYNIQMHIVWTTKYRYKVLNGRIGERVRELIRQSCNKMDVAIISGNVGKDHIHLLVSMPPSLSVEKLVQELKYITSRKILKEYREVKQRYLGRHMWALGYFCWSKGFVTKKTIKDYIENQSYEDNFKVLD